MVLKDHRHGEKKNKITVPTAKVNAVISAHSGEVHRRNRGDTVMLLTLPPALPAWSPGHSHPCVPGFALLKSRKKILCLQK